VERPPSESLTIERLRIELLAGAEPSRIRVDLGRTQDEPGDPGRRMPPGTSMGPDEKDDVDEQAAS
jgi:hypothetical protein